MIYIPILLEECSRKADERQRDEILKKTKTKDEDTTKRTFLISTYQDGGAPLKGVVDSNWDSLGASKTTKSIYNTKLTHGYKRPKNIKDYLVKARTDYHPDRPPESRDNTNRNYCSTPNCDLCVKIDRSGSVTSKTTGRTHKTMWNVTCKSSNVIYILTCKICGMQYVGQTQRELGKRLDEHLSRENSSWGRGQ